MRIQSTADFSKRGLDAYFTCCEAIQSLILLEGDRLPRRIWEPAAGGGAIVIPLRASGRFVFASDIFDYGLSGCALLDYRTTPVPHNIEGLVSNFPFRWAQLFLQKALPEVPYVALLLRTNFVVEGDKSSRWLDAHEPTRVWHSAERLPMMHRYQWQGKRQQYALQLGCMGARCEARVPGAILLEGLARGGEAVPQKGGLTDDPSIAEASPDYRVRNGALIALAMSLLRRAQCVADQARRWDPDQYRRSLSAAGDGRTNPASCAACIRDWAAPS